MPRLKPPKCEFGANPDEMLRPRSFSMEIWPAVKLSPAEYTTYNRKRKVKSYALLTPEFFLLFLGRIYTFSNHPILRFHCCTNQRKEDSGPRQQSYGFFSFSNC